MRLLILGRSYPEVETGMVGIFEYEQAQAVAKYCNEPNEILYTFCDNRSILRLSRFNSITNYNNSITTSGKYFPLGGLPTGLFNKFKSKLSISMLKDTISKFGKPDIIHIHFPIITLTADIWEYLTSLQSKIVITEHYSKVQKKELSDEQIELLRKIVRKADKFLCVNKFIPISIEELTGIKREFIVIPNVVAPFFSHNTTIDDSTYRFISIGRLVKDKKFDLLIKAFAKKFKDTPEVQLLIVGNGEEYKNLEKLINELNIKGKIILTGFLSREETAKLIEKSNSYVTSSSFETFGVPVVEAMTCGKPVLVAETSPLKEYITLEKGLFFKVDNIESLADMMGKLYEERFIFAEKSKEIASFAIENFSEKAIGEKLCDIYNSCLNH